ncbi:MAG: Na+/H+ antiporter NhaC family protein [Xanthomonadales bacterium]|nr:Na+/H+ antiporter NhaC family protein [Xanthomonadales bacterium]
MFISTIANAAETTPQAAGSWIAIIPPLLTIAVALTIKRVIPALFLGIWMGAWIINDFGLMGIWTGLLDTFQVFVANALSNPDHAAIVLFSMMVGGMVSIITRNGGMQGIVNHIVAWADSARHACVATWALGVAIFFDDYANTLVVGNTMRPVTDSMRVSRAKLAYIVDSTAAPVACIAVVTTWIGYEIGLIGDSLSKMDGLDTEAYLLFLNTLPYSFYPILAILFVLMVSASGRDFGPMLESERRAQAHGSDHDEPLKTSAQEAESLAPIDGKPQRAFNAYIPVLVMVLGVVAGLYVTGMEASADIIDPTLKDIIGNADSYTALMWASLCSMMTAALLSMSQKILNLEEVVNAWVHGVGAMLMAMIILILAWSLGEVTDILKTAEFLTSVLGDTLPVFLLPTIVFILAAIAAFATGSSWGAMGILFPLVMPLTWAVMNAQGQAGPEHMHILYSSISAILAGAVWGDHCSPISDTTILSSLASGCDHIEHVRTQLPYAMTVGGTAILFGSIMTALGSPWWLGMSIGLVVLWLILRFYGQLSRDPQVA